MIEPSSLTFDDLYTHFAVGGRLAQQTDCVRRVPGLEACNGFEFGCCPQDVVGVCMMVYILYAIAPDRRPERVG